MPLIQHQTRKKAKSQKETVEDLWLRGKGNKTVEIGIYFTLSLTQD